MFREYYFQIAFNIEKQTQKTVFIVCKIKQLVPQNNKIIKWKYIIIMTTCVAG